MFYSDCRHIYEHFDISLTLVKTSLFVDAVTAVFKCKPPVENKINACTQRTFD